jgi:DNA (cytosine-5)-methyltransferase 1
MSLFDGAACFPLAWANVNNIKHQDLEYYSSEIMPFLTDVIKDNFPKSIQLNDVNNIDLKNIDVDLITMGTPCPGFSLSGNGEGLDNEESKLFSIGIDIVNKVRPKYVIWENVFGVLSSKKGSDYREILDSFKKIGYDVAWALLDSKYFDLPQRRRRIYVVGVRDGIKEGNNIFDIKKRQSLDLINECRNSDAFFEYDLNPSSKKASTHFAYFNRQRSDKFREIGISNTIAKRDYKSATDIVGQNGVLRRITPKERLRLQGIPDYWFDKTYSRQKSDINRFKANGMAINVLHYVYENLIKINNGDSYSTYNKDEDEFDFEHTSYTAITAHNIHKNKNGDNINISPTGQMLLERDAKGEIISQNAKYKLANKCSESSPKVSLRKINSILESNPDPKYNITKGIIEGLLKKERKSGNIFPSKMKDIIFYQYPEFINF